MPDGVLINGKGPYRYNDTLVPAGIESETITVQPGEWYEWSIYDGSITYLDDAYLHELLCAMPMSDCLTLAVSKLYKNRIVYAKVCFC